MIRNSSADADKRTAPEDIDLESFSESYLESTRRPAIYFNVCFAILLVVIAPIRHLAFGLPLFPSTTSLCLEWAVVVPACVAIALIRLHRLSASNIARTTSLLIALSMAALAYDLDLWRDDGIYVPHGYVALFFLAMMSVAGLRMAWVVTLGVLFLCLMTVTTLMTSQSGQVSGFNFYFDLLALLFTLLNARAQKMEARRSWEMQMRLKAMAFSDPLTGLANRRRLEEGARRLFAQARRSGKRMGVALLDLDRFKGLNDRHGHDAGDQALQSVANILRQSTRRPFDIAARIGGDEFVLVWFDTTAEHCQQLSQRIRDEVAAARIPNGGGEGYLTASIGFACGPVVDGDGFDRLRREADEQLYSAKRRSGHGAYGGTALAATVPGTAPGMDTGDTRPDRP